MKITELKALIRTEIRTVIREEMPTLIRPLVKEAVAGALARIIAEGVVEGPPLETSRPRSAVQNTKSRSLSTENRRQMMEEHFEPIAANPVTGNPAVDSILSEMAMNGVSVPDERSVEMYTPSVLDKLDRIDPSIVDSITRDHSSLMRKMGLSNGK